MKKIFKKYVKYTFGIGPLAIIVIVAYFLISPAGYNYSGLIKQTKTASIINNTAYGLPCGFIAYGLQQPEQPTFITNNSIPVLQYPAGNYPGTNAQIPDALYSASQSDQLILQPDGNLVIYCTACNPGRAIWSSQTNGRGGKALFFQADGDLVLRNGGGRMIWHSNIHSTCAGSEQAYYTLQDDGNLVMLYDETINNNSNSGVASPASPVSSSPVSNTSNSNVSSVATAYLGGTGSTNDQVKMQHPGKIQ